MGGDAGHSQSNGMHTGIFHGVEHADEIRDLIRQRLQQFRETGLGDPDEARHHRPEAALDQTGAPAMASGSVLEAARDLLAETRQLRATLQGRSAARGGEADGKASA